ncbi:unnamed protein product [Rotaria sp. Silwood2]|nr:unnamed protein product [Rotaria sp. Silwood2]
MSHPPYSSDLAPCDYWLNDYIKRNLADQPDEKSLARVVSKLKLSTSQKCILCTRLTASAWARTLKSINFSKALRSLGYTWVDNSIVQTSHIQWYKFDPNSMTSKEPELDDHDQNSQQQEPIPNLTNKTQHKQLTLKDMWKIRKL